MAAWLQRTGIVIGHNRVRRLMRLMGLEAIYIKDYEDVDEARRGMGTYLRFYNRRRLHQALGYRTLAEVYFSDGPDATLITNNSITDALQLVEA